MNELYLKADKKETLLIIDVNEDKDELKCNSDKKEQYSKFLNNLEKIIKEYHSKSWEIIYLPNHRCDFSVYKEFKTDKDNYSDRFKELSKRFPFLRRFPDTKMHIALEPKEIDKIIESTNNSANFSGNYSDECVAFHANNAKKRNHSSRIKVLINNSFSRKNNKHERLKNVLDEDIIIE